MRNIYCRFCGVLLEHTFVDLGMSPLSNNFLTEEQLQEREHFYPLHAYVCSRCFLVQLEAFESPEQIFSDYAYFSSYSQSWLDHSRRYVNSIVKRFRIGSQHQVVEIASNDGYLLQYFKNKEIPVLGVEPAANIARAAQEAGIPSVNKFFGVKTAKELFDQGLQADLLIGNNVLPHVPELNDFIAGFKILLKPDGIITLEFPHLMQLIIQTQFDTIYHEHFSYFSLLTVKHIFAHHGLTVFDVDEIPTHGGSLRIYVRHQENDTLPETDKVRNLVILEQEKGLDSLDVYASFQKQVRRVKHALLHFLINATDEGKTIVGYGAAAKGNTLLNYCGIRCDFIDYVVDRSPHKQGRYLPGTHIPIYAPNRINETRPDYLLILPWNLCEEITTQMDGIRAWGGRFVLPIPKVEVYS